MTGILNGFEHVPPKFEVLAKLCTLLRSPYVEISQIVELVALDPGLSSSVVRLANSPYYGCKEPVDHIENAVERIGFTEVMKIVGVLGRKAFPPCPLNCYGLSEEDSWKEALGSAVLMEYLAYHADMEPGTAYLVGLMHGIGRYPIAKMMQIVKPGEKPSGHMYLLDQAKWERTMVDTDYALVGQTLLQMWRFGPEVYEPIGLHLQPFLRQGNKKMACLLNICLTTLPYLLGEGVSTPPEIPASNLASVGLTEETLISCIEPSRAWLSSTDTLLDQAEKSA
jgi:HD-like signal output (HDOD) protein